MTTSGTYAFGFQVDDLLTEAWERIQLNPEVLTDRHAAAAMRSLQLALISWTNNGINLWQVERLATTLSRGQASFTLPAGSVDVLEAVLSHSDVMRQQNQLLLTPISRDSWMAIPNKALQARPTSFWVEKVEPVPVVHFWPVPNESYDLVYSRVRLPQDVSALSQSPDAPALWSDALAAEVAARLARKYRPEAVQALRAEAQEAFAAAAGENRERAPFRVSLGGWPG
jgi:hypothetical protein